MKLAIETLFALLVGIVVYGAIAGILTRRKWRREEKEAERREAILRTLSKRR